MTHITEIDNGYHFKFGDALPLGLDVANTYEMNGLTPGQKRAEGLAAAGRIKEAAGRLLDSTEDAHVESVRQINVRFSYDNPAIVLEDCPIPSGRHKNVLEWLSESSRNEVAAFGRWNVNRYAQMQHALDVVTPELYESTRARVAKLITTGLFQRHVSIKFDDALRTMGGIRAIDSFESGSIGGANGYYSNTLGSMACANLFTDKASFTGIGSQLPDTTFHEAMHGTADMFDVGFIWGSDHLFSRILEEVTVAHATAVSSSRHPEPGLITPSERTNNKGAYQSIRELVGAIITNAPNPITARDLTAAYFRTDRSSARRSVLALLDENVKDLLPDFKDTGLIGLSDAYEKAFHTGAHRELVPEWIETALKGSTRIMYEDQEPSSDGPAFAIKSVA